MTIGALSGSAASGSVDVFNNIFSGSGPVDRYMVVAKMLGSGLVINGASVFHGLLELEDPSATVLTNHFLPTVQPDPLDFVGAQNSIVLSFSTADNNLATLTATNLSIAGTVTSVAEPDLLGLLSLGLAALGLARRKRVTFVR